MNQFAGSYYKLSIGNEGVVVDFYKEEAVKNVGKKGEKFTF